MNTKKILIILTGIISLWSCNSDAIVDYEMAEAIVFENKSSHSIVISRVADATVMEKQYIPETMAIAPNGRCEINVYTSTLCSAFGSVVFDGQVVADYQSMPHCAYNITRDSNYLKQEVSEYSYHYIYTFMDADYQYALMLNTNQ